MPDKSLSAIDIANRVSVRQILLTVHVGDYQTQIWLTVTGGLITDIDLANSDRWMAIRYRSD